MMMRMKRNSNGKERGKEKTLKGQMRGEKEEDRFQGIIPIPQGEGREGPRGLYWGAKP